MKSKQAALDDDNDILRHLVMKENVDYLTYHFNEMDLAASWRVLTKQKLNISNGIRLENASWRTWAKQRNNLKTINPNTLNWLKDNDVTWLYGPLHSAMMNEKDRFSQSDLVTIQKKSLDLGLYQKNNDKKKPLKSALKKTTPFDLLKRSASELGINRPVSIMKVNQELETFSPTVFTDHHQPKLRFNQYVEQCVVLSSDEDNESYLLTDLDDCDISEDTTSNSDGESIDDENNIAKIQSKPYKTPYSIKKIKPTLLKTISYSDNEDHDFTNIQSEYHYKNKTKDGNSDIYTHYAEVSNDPDINKVPTDTKWIYYEVTNNIILERNKRSDHEFTNSKEYWEAYDSANQSKDNIEYDHFILSAKSRDDLTKNQNVSQNTNVDKDDVNTVSDKKDLFNSIVKWVSSHVWSVSSKE